MLFCLVRYSKTFCMCVEIAIAGKQKIESLLVNVSGSILVYVKYTAQQTNYELATSNSNNNSTNNGFPSSTSS